MKNFHLFDDGCLPTLSGSCQKMDKTFSDSGRTMPYVDLPNRRSLIDLLYVFIHWDISLSSSSLNFCPSSRSWQQGRNDGIPFLQSLVSHVKLRYVTVVFFAPFRLLLSQPVKHIVDYCNSFPSFVSRNHHENNSLQIPLETKIIVDKQSPQVKQFPWVFLSIPWVFLTNNVSLSC